ncbi:Flp family type IVb pilin [Croceibacterium sp. TMG7-5b_MA50]|uniref:Flp family type IVb pilin n=1 Tax=Croceibacterium sp. TMG7-5b_MA50 TaxID=3121290 RepID=UPI003222053B
MGIIHRFKRRLIADRTGATMIEYALLAALLAMLIVGTLGQIGDHFDAILQAAADGFQPKEEG